MGLSTLFRMRVDPRRPSQPLALVVLPPEPHHRSGVLTCGHFPVREELGRTSGSAHHAARLLHQTQAGSSSEPA